MNIAYDSQEQIFFSNCLSTVPDTNMWSISALLAL